MKQPWLKFYASDWLGEPTLRVCSLAARGLWVDVLMLMHQSPRRGHLLSPSGAPFTLEQLARVVGVGIAELDALLSELRGAGVFSEDEGVIFSRRMAREEAKAAKCSAAGKRGGGNPALATTATVVTDRESGEPATFKGCAKGGSKGDPQRPLTSPLAPPLTPPSEPPSEAVAGAQLAPARADDDVADGAEDRGVKTLTFKGLTKGGGKGDVKRPLTPPLTQKPEARSITSPSEKCGPDGTAVGGTDESTEDRPEKAKKATNSNHTPAVRAFCDAWAAKYGAKYPFARAKDAALIADVLAAVDNDLKRFGAVVARYLADPWPFAADSRHDLGTLRLKLPRWLVAPTAAPATASSEFRPAPDFDSFPPRAAS